MGGGQQGARPGSGPPPNARALEEVVFLSLSRLRCADRGVKGDYRGSPLVRTRPGPWLGPTAPDAVNLIFQTFPIAEPGFSFSSPPGESGGEGRKHYFKCTGASCADHVLKGTLSLISDTVLA